MAKASSPVLSAGDRVGDALADVRALLDGVGELGQPPLDALEGVGELLGRSGTHFSLPDAELFDGVVALPLGLVVEQRGRCEVVRGLQEFHGGASEGGLR